MTFVFIHEGDKGQYILIISGLKLNSCSSSFLYNISTLEKHNLNILCWCSNITGSANVKKTYLNKHFIMFLIAPLTHAEQDKYANVSCFMNQLSEFTPLNSHLR